MHPPRDTTSETKRSPRGETAVDALVERACSGDRDAFDRLAVRAMPRLLGTARRLTGSAADAEEAVADALFRAYVRLPAFRRGSAFETWVHRILCRVAVDRWRSRSREARRREEFARRATQPAGPGPLQRASGLEQAARVRRAVEALPPLQRWVVVLHVWEGLGLHDVADALSSRYATVKSNLHHARAALRARLGEEVR